MPPLPPDAPPHLTSRMPLAVRFCETDLMGIVHHSNYVVYLEAGRIDWLQRRGISYEEMVRRELHLAVAELRLKYRQPARFGDTLVVETTCREIQRVTARFSYRILRGEDVICDGDILLACLGSSLTLTRIPDDIAQLLWSPEIPAAG
ncbi:acyl-CoA thioesterase [Sorangium cellulosum]|uniref:Thioesterase n=1 Tax=Sorangium cellulosum TaxID=56 RepID=A0A150PZU3_SORCE|nr:thioesterase family protein [Sorangium cellulosum]KYF61219.1 thioesterase [Sorangium cellulosum]